MNKRTPSLLILLALLLGFAPTPQPSAALPLPPAEAAAAPLAWEQVLDDPHVHTLRRSPWYDVNRTLYAISTAALHVTTDDGAAWATLYARETLTAAIHSMACDPAATWNPTLFVAVNETGVVGRVLRSSDNGVSWQAVLTDTEHAILTLAAVRDASDQLVVFAVGELRAWRSPDGGETWLPLHEALPEFAYLYHLAPSPNFAADGTIYATGYATPIRSTDGGFTWEQVHIPWVDIPRKVLFSPDYANDQTLWVSYFWVEGSGDDNYPMNGVVRSTDGGATWEKVNEGLPMDWPDDAILGLDVSPEYPDDPALFIVKRANTMADENYVLYRSPHRGDAWILQGVAPNATARDLVAARRDLLFLTTEEGLFRLHLPCAEALRNGDCELNEAWHFPQTPAPAGYTTEEARSPERSIRVGLTTAANVYSYSTARQWLTLPSTLVTATLEAWLYPISTETQLAQLAANAAAFPTFMAGDAQYVYILDAQLNLVEQLLWTRSNSRQWERHTFDLSAYIGQSIWVLFGVYNDGAGGKTGMYVDDVSLQGCRPPSTPPPPPEPSPPRPLPSVAPAEEDLLLTDAASAQYRPALAYNGADDETLLLWEDYRSDGPITIYGQRVSSDGRLLGQAFDIRPGRNPQAAYLGSAGLYLVVWEDHRNIGQTPDIYAQRVDRHGQRVGDDFPIVAAPGYQGFFRIAVSAQEGHFFVVWANSVDGISSVWGQRVDVLGNLVGDPIAISDGSGWAGHPAVAYSVDTGEYVVVWTDARNAQYEPDIYGQRIAAHDGALMGGNFPVSARAAYQGWPVIAIEPQAGRIFVAWEEEAPGERDLYGVQLAANGTPLTQEFTIATELGSMEMVAVTAWNQLERQEFLVIWQTNTGGGDLAAQRYAQGGGPLGMPFFVSHERHTQAKPAVVVLQNADPRAYFVVWEDFRAGGPGGIYGQRLTPEGERIGLHVGLTPLPYLQTQPALAYSSTSDRSLIVWANVHGGGGNQTTHVMAYSRLESLNYLATHPLTLTEQALTTTTQVSVDWDYWDDTFLAVWSEAGNIVGQVIGADGSLSGGNIVVSALEGEQAAPVVAAGMNAYLVIFEYTHPLSQTTDIYGQLLTLAGTPLGKAFNISRLTEAAQQTRNAHLTYNAIDNTFYVVWEEEDLRSAGLMLWDIVGQVVAGEDGTLLGPRRALANELMLQENHPRIAWAGPEETPFYLLVWSAFDMDLGQANIMARRLGLDGAPVSDPYALTTSQLEQELRPALSYDPFSRRFLVVWDVTTQGMPYADAIQGMQLGANGQPESAALIYVQALDSARQAPAVTARRGHGAWLVAWEDGRADTALEHINIYGRYVALEFRLHLPLVLRQ